MKKKKLRLSPGQAIAAGFLGIILTGALLLMLPIANRSGQGPVSYTHLTLPTK